MGHHRTGFIHNGTPRGIQQPRDITAVFMYSGVQDPIDGTPPHDKYILGTYSFTIYYVDVGGDAAFYVPIWTEQC